MEQSKFNTNPSHLKGKHLNFEERVIIQTRLRDGWSFRKIAREIGCAVNTVRNEYSRGKVLLYNGKIERYRAEDGQAKYEANRENCGRKFLTLTREKFLRYVLENFRKKHWSLDACVGRALKLGIFKRDEIVCTKTLYNYVSLGLLNIKNIELPLKVKRKNSSTKERVHKKKLGRSIEERAESVTYREEFGHLECDLIVGNISDDDVILNIVERKTRYSFVYKLSDKKVSSVMKALGDFRNLFGESFNKIFHTITTDNGSEFSSLAELEQISKILVYFAHPYS